MRKHATILFLFLIGFTLQSQAQVWTDFKTDTKDFLFTGQDFYGATLSGDKQTYTNAALIGAGIIGVSLLDKTVRSFAMKHQSTFGNSLFSIDNYYGDKWYTAGGIAVLYLGGLLSEHEGLRKTGLLTAEAWFYTGLMAVFVKELFGRSRPYRDSGPYDFHPFSFTEPKRSFFSGHASTVFAVSTVMASRIDNIFWKTTWYAAALLISGARMYHDKHWFSDVTAGAIFGYAVGRFVVHRAQNQTSSKIKLSSDNSAAGQHMIGITVFLD